MATSSHDSQHYERLIKQMQVLSVSQSAFLKEFLHRKLSKAVKLVHKSLELLSNKGNNNDKSVSELYADLESLKLNEIEVDVNSSQILMSEELKLLRKSINDHLSPHSRSNPDDNEHKSLIDENNNLRSLLLEAKAEIASASQTPNSTLVMKDEKLIERVKALEKQVETQSAQLKVSESKIVEKDRQVQDILNSQASDSSQLIKELHLKLDNLEKSNSAKDKELKELESKIAKSSSSSSSLSNELASVEAKLNEKTNEANDKDVKINELTNTNKSLQSEILSLQKSFDSLKKESELTLKNKVKELTELSDKRVKEVTDTLEAEKEVMMDAMSQEVEELEAAKQVEIDKLSTEVGGLKASLEKTNNFKKILSTSVLKTNSCVKSLSTSYKSVASDIKRELNDFKQVMNTLFSGTLIRRVKSIDDQITTLNSKYKRELMERKRLHNLVQELKGNIRVFMRCRPPTSKEIEQHGADQLCVSFPNDNEVKVFNEKMREKVWEFDEVFGLDSTQEAVYRDVSDLVVSVLDGYNVCIFAYGQTGSGKTWTMMGPSDNRGVNTRALNELFERAQARSGEWVDTINVSILEVYNEEIHDLLIDKSSQDKLEVRQSEFGNYVPGLTAIQVNNLQQVIDLLNLADKYRSQSVTNMNEHSSRSHMMLTVTINSDNKVSNISTRGKLNLVDLAGSERINKSGATGQALKEAQNINKSLSSLGDVIAARAAKQAHIPFRNSTLTYLLQDSLSQDSKTLMIVCASPMLFNAEETFCSLNFASRVRTVELGKVSKNITATGASSGSANASAAGNRLSIGAGAKKLAR